MSKKAGIAVLILTCALLAAGLSVSFAVRICGKEQPFTGKAAEYCDSLMQAGFPEDYAVSLTRLHLLHPEWEFVPLVILETDSDYTWSYVIDRETEHPKTNLIPAGSSYAAYRHPTNNTLYDAGYHQPSREAVEYFMDPRNFLNEADIFQFYDLSRPGECSEQALYAVLEGTFMANTVLENGKTYARNLMDIGEELGVDPVYLAVKLRQEQGTAGTSPIISGQCGSTLLRFYEEQTQTTASGQTVSPPAPGSEDAGALLELNGLYNPFNVGASGNGVYSIYKNAMLRAREGSESFAAEWGGSAAWDTVWKGLYGGAEFIRDRYINQYQSTIYLQKFNVDGRVPDRNFWSQYMQNVAGALTEGRTLYQFFATNDMLDTPCRFLIPVYAGMEEESPDPANGQCAYLAQATRRYETSAALSQPLALRATNDGVYGEVTLTGAESLTLAGKFTHSYGVRGLEYSWDGEEWRSCAQDGDLLLSFSGNLPGYGEHILLIRGEAAYDSSDSSRKSCRYFLCAALNVTVVPPPSVELTLQSGNAVSRRMYYEGSEAVLPVCEDPQFAGWVGSDGSLLPSGGSLTMTADVRYTALFLHPRHLEGAALPLTGNAAHLRFYAVLPEAEYRTLASLPSSAYRFCAGLRCGDEAPAATEAAVGLPLTDSAGGSWRQLTANTPELGSRLSAECSAAFAVELYYADGSSKRIPAEGGPVVRSATEVAAAALADRTAAYSPAALEALRRIADQTI